MSYQSVSIIGNLGSNPEMRYMPDGTAVTNFSVAVNRRWNVDGETHEETTWFRVSVWGKQAEACNQYLEQGRQVHVDGRLRPDKATGGPRIYQRNDGSVGASYELTASSVTFLGGRGATAGDAAADDVNQQPQEEDEIPF